MIVLVSLSLSFSLSVSLSLASLLPFLIHTHTHSSVSVLVCVCVCACVSFIMRACVTLTCCVVPQTTRMSIQIFSISTLQEKLKRERGRELENIKEAYTKYL